MEHAGFGATYAATVVAEKYITGELKREHLYKMITSSFMPEYKRQWIVDLKRKGLYVEPNKQDSIQKRKNRGQPEGIENIRGATEAATTK